MNAAAKILTHLMTAGQIPAMPQAASPKHTPSAFDELMRDKYRTPPSGERAPQTDPGNKTPDSVHDDHSTQVEEEPVTDEQYVLAAALSAPAAGIFMPIPMMVNAEQDTPDALVDTEDTAVSLVSALDQTYEMPGQTMDLEAVQTDASEMVLQHAEHTPVMEMDDASSDVAPESLSAVNEGRPGMADVQSAKTSAQDESPELDIQTVYTPVFDAVESVPVKVGETEALPVDTEAGDLDVQLTGRLADAIQKGETRIAVRLTPENLGTMQVQLTRGSDGSLHVMLGASTEKAMALLERHSEGLQNLLMANTQTSVKIEVHHSAGQQPQQSALDQNGSNRQGQQQQNRDPQTREQAAENFMQQLRLGLIDLSDTVS